MAIDPKDENARAHEREELLAQELEDMRNELPANDGWPEPTGEPVEIDDATERAMFADLLALLSADDDDDSATEVTVLSLDDYDTVPGVEQPQTPEETF